MNQKSNNGFGSHPGPRDEYKTRVLLAICILVVMMLILLIVLMISNIVSLPHNNNDFDESKNNESAINSSEIRYEDIICSESDVHAGALVLVDKDHKYIFPAETTATVNIYNTKVTSVYSLSDSGLLLNEDAFNALNKMMIAFNAATGSTRACVVAAYRSEAEQQKKYNEDPSSYAAPGYSEFHTGNDIAIRLTNPSASIDSDDGQWITENCCKYGFIRRYPDSKADITGENESKYTSKQFRYVGYAHAYYMNRNDLCFEEYLEYLRTNTSQSNHLSFVGDNNVAYEIYYVKASGGQLTTVSVPSNCSYTISGDNIGGFIVTVTLG